MNPVVYYAERDGLIKIGFSRDIKARVRDLGVTLLAVEPGDFKLEKQRHAEFADSRTSGEWFTPSPPLVEHIESISRAGYTEAPGEVLTSAGVAQLFRVTVRTVAKWQRNGKLPSFRTIGGHLRFYRSDIEDMLDSERRRGPDLISEAI